MKQETKDLMDMTLREIYSEYYGYCRSIAAEIIENFGLDAVKERTDDVETRLAESIDGSQWVIYTFRAELVSILSENDDAYLDVYGENEPVTVEQKAYLAMDRDINDYFNNEYFLADFAA